MSPLQLLVALSGLAVIVVLGQSEYDFADPPPLPEKGTIAMSIYSNMLASQISRTHIHLCDPPLL